MNHRRRSHPWRRSALAGVGAILIALLMVRARAAAHSDTPQAAPAAEVTSHDSEPSMQLRVQHNEVVVRVIVRDQNGRVVTNLQKDDFHIFDNGKPQPITHFAVENAAANPPALSLGKPGGAGAPAAGEAHPAPAIVLPRRFLALYFDDMHLTLTDLSYARDAANYYLSTTMQAGDRAALFTSSGQNQMDFTDDRQKLHDALLALRPRSVYRTEATECPDITPYQAFKIVHEHDPNAIQIAYEEAFECLCDQTSDAAEQAQCRAQVSNVADAMAVRVLDNSLDETEYALRGLEMLCRRMARVPGQRAIVLVSPGFLTRSKEYNVDQIVDQALRQNIVISSLDARGLYVNPLTGNASRPVVAPIRIPQLMGYKDMYQMEELQSNADVLAQVADQTGGVFFHNSNDLRDGFKQTGTFPQTFFMLAFAPLNLKLDGRLHTLNVRLTDNSEHYSLQFRRGYFAPDKAEDAATVAREELAQMVYSQEEVRTIPIEIHTQFFKAGAGDAKLSVLTHVDIGAARFKKANGRNLDNLVLMTALFDRAGNYVMGQRKTIEFRLFDATLARLLRTGLNVRSTLPVKPGTYLVREVVDDSGSDQMSAINSTVEIPQ